MKRFITTLLLLLAMLVPQAALVGQAAAVDIFTNCGSGSAAGTPGVCTDAHAGEDSTVSPIASTIGSIVTITAFVIGVAAVIGIIASGIRMMTASGDPSSVATARNALIYCLIGLAVAALAGVIVRIVLGALN